MDCNSKQGGNLLSYTVFNCGSNTTFKVSADTSVAGTQTIYIYYGNPSAPNGFGTFSRDDLRVGADDYVDMGDQTALDLERTSPITLSAWVKSCSICKL